MERDNPGGASRRRQLPSALQLHVLSLLPPNDRALSGRLACRDAAEGLSGPQHCTASLSQPLPPRAVPWALEAGQQHVRQLPFRHKLQLMCTAAASGSEVNLEVARALLQPSVFPELLQGRIRHFARSVDEPNPGVAAVKAGHPQLLRWLLQHCLGLVCPNEVLRAAALHCDLAGLQAAWHILQNHYRSSGRSRITWQDIDDYPLLGQGVLDAAAESAAPDAVAKMAWLLAAPDNNCGRLQESNAAAAARSGDLGRLRWLREQGCPMGGESRSVLLSALQHANLAVAQWLVDEAGCCVLPAAESEVAGWESLVRASFASIDGMAKLRWLQARGAPPLTTYIRNGRPAMQFWTCSAIESGRVETVQYLLSAFEARQLPLGNAELCSKLAAKSGSIPMAECLRGAGLVFTQNAYAGAAEAGSLAVVRWLAQDAKVSTGPDLRDAQWLLAQVLASWPCRTPADSRDLLEAVQLLVEAGATGMAVAGAEQEEEDVDEEEEGEGDEGAGLVCSPALRRGDLALVQYLQQQRRMPVPLLLEPHYVDAAAKSGCEVLLEWLAGQPGCLESPGVAPYVAAALKGDLGTLTTLRRLGVPWGDYETLGEAVRQGCCVPALRWLVEQGVAVGGAEEMEAAVQRALNRGSLGTEAAAWLRGLAAGGTAGGATGAGA